MKVSTKITTEKCNIYSTVSVFQNNELWIMILANSTVKNRIHSRAKYLNKLEKKSFISNEDKFIIIFF